MEHDLFGKPVSTFPDHALGYTFPIALVASAEPLMRASYVSESNHLRQRASEMRASSKELKDDNRAVPPVETKEDGRRS